MKLADLFYNVPDAVFSGETDIYRINIDSRKALPGDLFVCLEGAATDGHSYARSAYNEGCRAFLCRYKPEGLPEDAVTVMVKNTREALAVISATFYENPCNQLKIIGITGTKGKTTTALLVTTILNSAGKNCAYIGSNGVIINDEHLDTMNTTPESLYLQQYFSMMVKSGVQYAAVEVSSQALARYRVKGIPFDTVVYTNLSEDHVGKGEHPDFEDYKNSKKRLFTNEYKAKNAVYNADDEYADYMLSDYRGNKVSYALKTHAEWRAENAQRYRDKTSLGITFDLYNMGKATEVSLMSPGEFSVSNALCAMAVCSIYGVPKEESAKTLSKTTVKGRFEIVPGIYDRTFVIDYAHNGISLASALKTLREYEPKRLICLFGSVGSRTEIRRKELAEAASQYADYVIITADNPDYEDVSKINAEIASHIKNGVPYEIINDRKEAIFKAVRMSEPEDIILLAGKGHETYQLMYGSKVPFCEKDILLEAFAEITEKV